MKTNFQTIAVFVLICFFAAPVFSQNNAPVINQDASCIDPVVCRLDSMSLSILTRDKFYVSDQKLLASINLPYDQAPKFTDAQVIEKMKLIPSLIPLNYNNTVRQFIDFFAYKRRDLIARCLANSQIYFPIFEEVLDKKGLPLELKYLPVVESALNPVAVSPAGATGLWQLMYGTGALLGLNVNSLVDERRDPAKATEAATDYLKKLYDMYGDWQLVLAAYNSGPGNVNKAIARAGGVKNFWAILNYLPAETRSYVPTYIAAVYVMTYYKDFKLESYEPRRELYAVDTVMITNKVTLGHIAQVLDIPVEELQFLNPGIKTGIIPYTQNGFALNLPVNYFALFEARKEDVMNDTSEAVREPAPVVAVTRTVWHKVKYHETIYQVAAHYGVSAYSIKVWNHLKGMYVYPGQSVKILLASVSSSVSSTYTKAFSQQAKPTGKESQPDTAADAGNDSDTLALDKQGVIDADSTVNKQTDSKATGSLDKINKECGCIYHVVQPGDTLWNIAERYDGITVEKLKADNKTLLEKPIKVGDVIKIIM